MTRDTVVVLLDALLCAADAHSFREARLGHIDPDWAQWYAEHMAVTLSDGGYRLVNIATDWSVRTPGGHRPNA